MSGNGKPTNEPVDPQNKTTSWWAHHDESLCLYTKIIKPSIIYPIDANNINTVIKNAKIKPNQSSNQRFPDNYFRQF